MTSLRLLAAAALAAPAIALAAPAAIAAPAAAGVAAPAERVAGPYGYGPARCVAAAFRAEGRGPLIRGTRGVGFAAFPRRACRRALRECWHRLRFAPAGPFARCIVVRVI